MKKLILLFTLFSSVAIADQPAYLKDAVITVTLTNGKVYTYSANEYMVVKRGAKTPEKAVSKDTAPSPVEVQTNKNIVSLELVNGQSGQTVSDSVLETEVKTKRSFGLGLQYQRNIKDDYYLGIRVDTLGNVGGSVGVGF